MVIPKAHPPGPRTTATPEVRRGTFLAPGFASVAPGGPAVRDLTVAGDGHTVRLFLPREGQGVSRMPAVPDGAWTARLMPGPKPVRPRVRNLTGRRVRPADDAIGVESVPHGDSPLSSRVRRAEPGDLAGHVGAAASGRRPWRARAGHLVLRLPAPGPVGLG